MSEVRWPGQLFKTVLTDPAARQDHLVTVLLTASVVLISLFLGLVIALLLDRKFLGRASSVR